MHVKNNGIFFISLSLGERAHDLCKSMIEMVSDNTAMQSVPKESMYVQESGLDCHISP